LELVNKTAENLDLPDVPLEKFSANEVFQLLLPQQIDALSKSSWTFTCKTGDTIYHQGMEVVHIYVVIEGKVALRLPGNKGVNVLIDMLEPGAMFGSCLSYNLGTYSLTAQSMEDSKILKIRANALKKVLDDDPRMGYAVQSRISAIYFKRYIQTMNKLQNVVTNIPLERE
jgi:CRP-like cAMP-binding protein